MAKKKERKPLEQRAAIAAAEAARLNLQVQFEGNETMKGFLRACTAVAKATPIGNKAFDEKLKVAQGACRDALKALQG